MKIDVNLLFSLNILGFVYCEGPHFSHLKMSDIQFWKLKFLPISPDSVIIYCYEIGYIPPFHKFKFLDNGHIPPK